MSFQNTTSCEGITNSGNTILFLLKVFIVIFLQDMHRYMCQGKSGCPKFVIYSNRATKSLSLVAVVLQIINLLVVGTILSELHHTRSTV